MSDSYSYSEQRSKLFTEEGSVVFNAVRDKAFTLNNIAGCFRADKAWLSGDSWLALACLDRMVELGEIKELTDPAKEFGQYRVFRRVERTA